jgi:hypothetical protein
MMPLQNAELLQVSKTLERAIGEEVEVAELRAEVRRHVLLDAQPAGCTNSITTVITGLKVLLF